MSIVDMHEKKYNVLFCLFPTWKGSRGGGGVVLGVISKTQKHFPFYKSLRLINGPKYTKTVDEFFSVIYSMAWVGFAT